MHYISTSEKMEGNRVLDILYTANNSFAAKVAAGICSVFENNRHVQNLTIYLLTDYMSAENLYKFRKMEKQYGRTIQVIMFGDIREQISFDFDTLGWNQIVLSRLLWDRFLPQKVERILYLDGDTIVNGSLEKLWEKNMGKCVLGACIEPTVDYKRRVNLGLKHMPYINSGVLLIDRKRWQEANAERRILDFYKENDGRLFAPDQDAINGALKGEIFFLEPKYNFYNIYWFYPYHFLKKLMHDTPYFSEDVYEKSLENPVILHYLGEERPWRKGNHHKYRDVFKKYSQKTPWKGEPEEEGWEIYYFFWGIFNRLTRYFPSLRYALINRLIPLFMKWRSRRLKKQGQIQKKG